MEISHYTVLEAKCVGNWKSEILWWAHYLVRNKKIVKYCEYRPCSLYVRRAYVSHAPARPPNPRQACPPAQHVAKTRYRDSSGLSVRNRSPGRGGGDGESPAHAPRFRYRLGTHGTVWGFGLILGHPIYSGSPSTPHHQPNTWAAFLSSWSSWVTANCVKKHFSKSAQDWQSHFVATKCLTKKNMPKKRHSILVFSYFMSFLNLNYDFRPKMQCKN